MFDTISLVLILEWQNYEELLFLRHLFIIQESQSLLQMELGTQTSFYGRKLLITYIYDTSTIVLLHLHS